MNLINVFVCKLDMINVVENINDLWVLLVNYFELFELKENKIYFIWVNK